VTELGKALSKSADQIEFANVRQKSLNVKLRSERISAFLAQREIAYADEVKSGYRSPNQDVVVVSQPTGSWHVGVADGVGGLPHGEIAAQQALRYIHDQLSRLIIPEFFLRFEPREMRAAIEAAMLRANAHVNAIFDGQARRGATTILGAFPFGKDKVVVYSVGDSQIALVPRSPMRPILYSSLHSTFERMVLSGLGSRREALQADSLELSDGQRMHDLLSSAIGGSTLGPRELFVSILPVRPGDNLFLFSDGLFKTVGRYGDLPGELTDFRRIEYGRADRLLQFLSDNDTPLAVVADKSFRRKHGGPRHLVDDTAVVRIEMSTGVESSWPAHDSRIIRPKSRLMTEITDDAVGFVLPAEEETVSITMKP
jgi:serine/threonine protein phosphatase PrpC